MCGARQKLAVLERVAVDGEREQVGSNAAVIEQGVALAGRAVRHEALAATRR